MHQLSLADSSKVMPKGVSVCICLMMMLVTLRLSHFFPSLSPLSRVVNSEPIIRRKLLGSRMGKSFAHHRSSNPLLQASGATCICRNEEQAAAAVAAAASLAELLLFTDAQRLFRTLPVNEASFINAALVLFFFIFFYLAFSPKTLYTINT